MIRSFVYRAFVRLRFRIVRWFHSVRSCIVRSFRVSCVFRILRVKRLVRFVNLYDPGSVHLFSTHVLFKSVLFKYLNYYHICDFKYLLDKNVVK